MGRFARVGTETFHTEARRRTEKNDMKTQPPLRKVTAIVWGGVPGRAINVMLWWMQVR